MVREGRVRDPIKAALRRIRWREKHPEKEAASKRAYFIRNKEKIKKAAHARYLANREAMCARSREYYARDPERKKASKQKWAAANKAKIALKSRRARLASYGLSLEEYDSRLIAQGGGCAICGARPNGRPLDVDHVHDESGRVRGLLCGRCNSTLERFEAVPNFGTRATSYLAGILPLSPCP